MSLAVSARQGVVFPLAAVEAVIGRAFTIRADAEQRAKGIERIEAPVKAEGEFVQVSLSVGVNRIGMD